MPPLESLLPEVWGYFQTPNPCLLQEDRAASGTGLLASWKRRKQPLRSHKSDDGHPQGCPSVPGSPRVGTAGKATPLPLFLFLLPSAVEQEGCPLVG